MDLNHKKWNNQQRALRQAFKHPEDHERTIDLFLNHHAMVHSAAMSGSGLWSFEDEIWQGLTEKHIRQIPSGGEHSIAWIFWHLTRIEDVTMNLLLAGRPQLINQEEWFDRLGIPFRDTGNAMAGADVVFLSEKIKIVVEEARGVLDYWSGLTYAGLLLMPPTRHNFIHLNEALRVKNKVAGRG